MVDKNVNNMGMLLISWYAQRNLLNEMIILAIFPTLSLQTLGTSTGTSTWNLIEIWWNLTVFSWIRFSYPYLTYSSYIFWCNQINIEIFQTRQVMQLHILPVSEESVCADWQRCTSQVHHRDTRTCTPCRDSCLSHIQGLVLLYWNLFFWG